MTSERAKVYSWLLTVIAGLAVTTAVREFSNALIEAKSIDQILPIMVRFLIFIFLFIRWSLGSLWYFDKFYISNPHLQGQDRAFLWDLIASFFNFMIFVPLALTISISAMHPSFLAALLNGKFAAGKQISLFSWILVLLLAYDVIWVGVMKLWSFSGRIRPPQRIHIFWLTLNLITLVFCIAVLAWHGMVGASLEKAETYILILLFFVALIDFNCTILGESDLSKWIIGPMTGS
jgi:hypothetical protein